MKKQPNCVITGSFDPFTVGHFCLVEKALEYFDRVYILIADNPNKKYMFSNHERQAIVEDAFNSPAYAGRVFVCTWHEMTVDWCITAEVYTIVRGVRDVTDMAYELNMARTNRILGENYDVDIDTIFIPTYGDIVSVSSSLIRTLIASNSKTWYQYVPNPKFIKQILDIKTSKESQKTGKELVMA